METSQSLGRFSSDLSGTPLISDDYYAKAKNNYILKERNVYLEFMFLACLIPLNVLGGFYINKTYKIYTDLDVLNKIFLGYTHFISIIFFVLLIRFIYTLIYKVRRLKTLESLDKTLAIYIVGTSVLLIPYSVIGWLMINVIIDYGGALAFVYIVLVSIVASIIAFMLFVMLFGSLLCCLNDRFMK